MKPIKRNSPDDDFSFDHYWKIIERIKETHRTLSFKDAYEMGRDILDIDKFVLMRHDIEFSLDGALELAKIDNCLDVQSTFFLLCTSDYNIFEESGATIVKKILDLGHDIGLHYDMALFEGIGVDPEQAARQMIALMETFWGTKIYSMSSHLPMRSGLTFGIDGLVDVYEPLYLKEIKYISDSAQKWREGVITSILDKYPKIHLLTHEYTWSPEGHGWDVSLLNEAKRKFDVLWNMGQHTILKYNQGLSMRKEKDAAFKKRYQLDDKEDE
jgi:hypothetical protein